MSYQGRQDKMAEVLDKYKSKRNFSNTAEPAGEPVKTGKTSQEDLKRLCFVVQHHIARGDHFDFRLEWGGVLLSWAVPKGPSYNTADKRLAVRVEDHPLEYMDFEGTIPKGEYGGGTVMLWDEGWWEPVPEAGKGLGAYAGRGLDSHVEGIRSDADRGPGTDVDRRLRVNVEKGLREGSLKFILKGRRLKGKWALVRLKPKEGETRDNWLLLKEKDEYAMTTDGVSGFITSVRTGRTMQEIENGESAKADALTNPFSSTGIQLARLAARVPEGGGWLFELKYDGYRIVAFIENNNVRLISRNGNDYTRQFGDITHSLVDLAAGRAMVLDGEMVVTDEKGKTDFQALQSYLGKPGGKSPTYIVFDLLALDGEDLRGRSLTERKRALEELLKNCPSNLHYSKHVRGNGNACFRAACDAGMEGIVAKRADSIYSGTRSGDWIKLKCDTRQEFVIGGYSLTDKRKSGVSSLLLGVYEGSELIYAGRAGTGFTERTMKELEERFKGIKADASPFKHVPKSGKNEKIIWLEPVLVSEIKFAGWTGEGLLRQASFKGLRTDKDPRDIKREDPDKVPVSQDGTLYDEIPQGKISQNRASYDGIPHDKISHDGVPQGKVSYSGAAQDRIRTENDGKIGEDAPARDFEIQTSGKSIFIGGIKISNPDRVIFEEPEIKKADVVLYYAKAAHRMLPYVGNRILSVIRCHKGISHACFFKKHPGADSKGIVTIPVMSSSGEEKEYFYIENVYGLISEAQMGTLEFHTWGSRAQEPEKPDLMVFDLDPDEGMDPDMVRQGVRDLKSVLDRLELASFLKTSGGKGYHVVVPFEPSAGWDVFGSFARQVAELMERKWPDRYTSNVRKDKRKNKIFIDWIRNGRGATSIAPYSLRARNGARVSMPIRWDELDSVAPDSIGIEEALQRIRGSDPWKGFHRSGQRLK